MSTVMPSAPVQDAIDANAIDLFVEGDELYDAMLHSIAAARHSVYLETYIFCADEVGKPILAALAAKAREGLDVRLHVDAFGSLFGLSRVRERRLRRSGVKVRRFHRWSWRDPWRYNRRNHRKILAVDRREAYIGGFNIHRESSRRHYGPERWRDTHVRMHGKLAAQTAELFEILWEGRRGRHVHRPFAADERHILLSSHDRVGRSRMLQLMDEVLDGARERIWFTNPYFVPSSRIQKRLVAAVRRGVDVRVLVPAKNDVRLARWASHAAYARLLAGGVRIFEYLPRVLHAKTMIADRHWSMVGSSNLDYRSFFLNFEINLFSADPSLCQRLHEQFLVDQEKSVEIFPDKWSARPWLHYPLEAIGWAARRLL